MSSNNKPPSVRAALCQLSSGLDVAANLARCEQMIADAAASGAQLVCLPELFNCMGADPAAKRAAAEHPARGPTYDFLTAQARAHKVYLAGGSYAVRGRSKLRNRSLLFSPAGRPLAQYDKIHLFRFAAADRTYDESELYEPGRQVVCRRTALGNIGLSVCYDLRFPELYRRMAQPDIILVPAAFTRQTGKAHWAALLRARAIENQCYMLAAAQCGEHPGKLRSWGRSAAVDPWGKIIGALGAESGVLMVELDLQRQAEVRAGLPALANRML